jgi:hypothetical protein
MVNIEYLSLNDSDDTYCADIATPWLPSVWNGQECLCRLAFRQSDGAAVIIYVDHGRLLGTQVLNQNQPAR